jgi:PAS domain S-box-containing protein
MVQEGAKMNRKSPIKNKTLSFAEDLIENLPIGMMLLDKNGKILRMNEKQEEASQIGREKIIGKTFSEAFPRTLEQGLKRHYAKLLRDGTPFDLIIDRYIPQYYSKIITYRARGSAFSSRRYFILLHEHAVELGQEKRLVEKRTKELQESKKFLESLIDSSPNIVISTDLCDEILIFNQTAEKIFGYAEEEVIKRKIDYLLKDIPLPIKGDWGNSPRLQDVICVKKDQTTFPVSLRISDIKNTRGKSIAKLYLLSDLTEKKQMEERLLLSEKLALYSELMGGIAHQLNNPLIGVVNFSEMLLKEMEDEGPKRELAETISKAGNECLRIITTVLSCIKDPYLTFSKTDVNKVLENALCSLEEQFGEKLGKVSIRTSFDQRVLSILGDDIQLKQCFLNIMTNAVQAMQSGGNLKIGTEHDESEKQIEITISDDGIGIPKEFLNKIFLPFFSLKKSSDRHGLGLSFAYQIVKNHGGYINVKSEIGAGTTFTVVLPTS